MGLANTIASRVKMLRVGDALVRRPPLLYSRALAAFDSLDAASLEERVGWTENRLAHVMQIALKTPYGRVHGGERIEDWPTLRKEAIRDSPSHFLRGPSMFSIEAATSGSTGVPIRLRRSLNSLAVEQAAIDRLLLRHGIPSRNHRAAVLRGDDIKDPADDSPPYWRLTGGGRRLIVSSVHLNERTAPSVVDALERFAPDVIHAYPTMLESLCLHLRKMGHSLAVPLTLCSSEVLPQQTWSLVNSTMKTRLVDHYGQAERVAFAYAEKPSSYVFLPGYSFNELMPAGDLDDGTFEIVATALWNLAMPIIRYRTGDLVLLDPKEDVDRVRFGLDPFDGIIGRESDYLLSPEGAPLIAVNHVPRGVEHVVRTQVVQQGRDVCINVIPAEGFNTVDRDLLLSNAARKLPPSMNVRVEVVSELLRHESGKVPFIVRR